MDDVYQYNAAAAMIRELKRANRKYGTSFSSLHVGYAVMLEETDEFFEEIRNKQPDKERLREEAIQVGAMAIKFIVSLENWAMAEERNCRKCWFNVMTATELAELGNDPCETCDTNSSHRQSNNEFMEILKSVAELLKRKNTDYGNSYNETRREFGPIAFLLRINDKFARLKTLTNHEAKVNEESVEDTLEDIIGYCTLELKYLRKKD